jgi:hypothetical protein
MRQIPLFAAGLLLPASAIQTPAWNVIAAVLSDPFIELVHPVDPARFARAMAA